MCTGSSASSLLLTSSFCNCVSQPIWEGKLVSWLWLTLSSVRLVRCPTLGESSVRFWLLRSRIHGCLAAKASAIFLYAVVSVHGAAGLLGTGIGELRSGGTNSTLLPPHHSAISATSTTTAILAAF